MNLEFLRSKLVNSDTANYNSKAGWGNVYFLAPNVLSFTEYNFLNGGDTNTKFDGHYTFYVNTENFNYVVSKFADYGGFTWIKDIAEENQVYFIPHPNIRAAIDSLVADKLMGAYYYDSEHINHKGANLYPYEDRDGIKRSLICHEDGELSGLSKAIVGLLNSDTQFGYFTEREAQKHKFIIPNPYIPNSWRKQYLALRAGILTGKRLAGDVYVENPIGMNIKDIQYNTDKPKKVSTFKSMTIETKGSVFSRYHIDFDSTRGDTRTKYLITKDDVIIYACQSSIFAPASDAFHAITEVYADGYNDAGGWVYTSLYDAKIVHHSYDGTFRDIDFRKSTDVQAKIKNLSSHF